MMGELFFLDKEYCEEIKPDEEIDEFKSEVDKVFYIEDIEEEFFDTVENFEENEVKSEKLVIEKEIYEKNKVSSEKDLNNYINKDCVNTGLNQIAFPLSTINCRRLRSVRSFHGSGNQW